MIAARCMHIAGSAWGIQPNPVHKCPIERDLQSRPLMILQFHALWLSLNSGDRSLMYIAFGRYRYLPNGLEREFGVNTRD